MPRSRGLLTPPVVQVGHSVLRYDKVCEAPQENIRIGMAWATREGRFRSDSLIENSTCGFRPLKVAETRWRVPGGTLMSEQVKWCALRHHVLHALLQRRALIWLWTQPRATVAKLPGVGVTPGKRVEEG